MRLMSSVIPACILLAMMLGCDSGPKTVEIKADPQAMEKLRNRLPPNMRQQQPGGQQQAPAGQQPAQAPQQGQQ